MSVIYCSNNSLYKIFENSIQSSIFFDNIFKVHIGIYFKRKNEKKNNNIISKLLLI